MTDHRGIPASTATGMEELGRRWRDVFAALPLGAHFYRLEPDGRLVFTGANPAADRILKVENRQFIGRVIEEAFPDLAGSGVPERYREVVRSGQPWETEHVVYADQQIAGAFSVHAVATGEREMVALFEDVTERRRSEAAVTASRAALATSEATLRAFLEALPDIAAVVGPGGVILECNSKLSRAIGRPSA
ncbi:MAG: PAS domain-containing protein, partial [Deltaproteobacteria bacterium]|nr:PAS domain-containing protein [Deltaproteobacteria bacterium]